MCLNDSGYHIRSLSFSRMSHYLPAARLFSDQHIFSKRKPQNKKRRQRNLGGGFVSSHIRDENQKVTVIKKKTERRQNEGWWGSEKGGRKGEASSLTPLLVFLLHLLFSSPPPLGFYSIRSLGFPLFVWRRHDAFKGVGSCRSFLSSSLLYVYRSLSLSLFIRISLSISPSFPLFLRLSVSDTHIFSLLEWNPTLIFHACPWSTYISPSLALFPSHFRCGSPTSLWMKRYTPLWSTAPLHPFIPPSLPPSNHLLKSDIKSIMFSYCCEAVCHVFCPPLTLSMDPAFSLLISVNVKKKKKTMFRARVEDDTEQMLQEEQKALQNFLKCFNSAKEAKVHKCYFPKHKQPQKRFYFTGTVADVWIKSRSFR